MSHLSSTLALQLFTPSEWLIILTVILLLFGRRLLELGQTLGQSLGRAIGSSRNRLS